MSMGTGLGPSPADFPSLRLIHEDLAQFEQTIQATLLSLKAVQLRYGALLGVLAAVHVYAVVQFFILWRPQVPVGGFQLPATTLLVASTVAVMLFFLSGLYSCKVRGPANYLTHCNAGLRPFHIAYSTAIHRLVRVDYTPPPSPVTRYSSTPAPPPSPPPHSLGASAPVGGTSGLSAMNSVGAAGSPLARSMMDPALSASPFLASSLSASLGVPPAAGRFAAGPVPLALPTGDPVRGSLAAFPPQESGTAHIPATPVYLPP